jgi:hypothetical protein
MSPATAPASPATVRPSPATAPATGYGSADSARPASRPTRASRETATRP